MTEPTHLVVKWSPTRGARTVDLHREISSQRRSVWWGLVGKAGTRKLSEPSLGVIREQLASDVTTYVFLPGPPTAAAWRTRLLAVLEQVEVLMKREPQLSVASAGTARWIQNPVVSSPGGEPWRPGTTRKQRESAPHLCTRNADQTLLCSFILLLDRDLDELG